MAAAVPGSTRRDRAVVVLVAAVSSVVVLRPAFGRGFALTYDMVFVPDPARTAALLGRGPEVPRAVPSDLLVALPSWVVGGALVQQLVLFSILLAAGTGAARLVRGPLLAQIAAAVAAVWNPWVAERLAIGQWALLVGYAATPWCVAAVINLRRRRPGALALLALCLAAAAAGGASAALVATGVSFVVALASRPEPGGWSGRLRAAAAVLAAAIAVNAPWWVPALLRPADLPVDEASVAAFASRAEPPLALLPTLLTGGGIWNSEVVPPERGIGLLAYLSLLLLAAAVFGLIQQHAGGSPYARPLAVAAIAGAFLAAISAGPLAGLFTSLVTDLPGGGLLRDAHKLSAPVTIATAVGVGGAVTALMRAGGRFQGLRTPAVVVLVLMAPALVPSLGLGLGGRLNSVEYPNDYASVASVLESRGDPSDLAVVLPWQPYRAFPWTGRRTVLEPLPRWLPTVTIVDDDLPVGDDVISGEGPVAARLDAAMTRPGPLGPRLSREGVRWVVVNQSAGAAPVPDASLAGLVQVYRGPNLALFMVPGVPPGTPGAAAAGVAPPLLPVLLGNGVAVATVVAALAGRLRSRSIRRVR